MTGLTSLSDKLQPLAEFLGRLLLFDFKEWPAENTKTDWADLGRRPQHGDLFDSLNRSLHAIEPGILRC